MRTDLKIFMKEGPFAEYRNQSLTLVGNFARESLVIRDESHQLKAMESCGAAPADGAAWFAHGHSGRTIAPSSPLIS